MRARGDERGGRGGAPAVTCRAKRAQAPLLARARECCPFELLTVPVTAERQAARAVLDADRGTRGPGVRRVRCGNAIRRPRRQARLSGRRQPSALLSMPSCHARQQQQQQRRGDAQRADEACEAGKAWRARSGAGTGAMWTTRSSKRPGERRLMGVAGGARRLLGLSTPAPPPPAARCSSVTARRSRLEHSSHYCCARSELPARHTACQLAVLSLGASAPFCSLPQLRPPCAAVLRPRLGEARAGGSTHDAPRPATAAMPRRCAARRSHGSSAVTRVLLRLHRGPLLAPCLCCLTLRLSTRGCTRRSGSMSAAVAPAAARHGTSRAASPLAPPSHATHATAALLMRRLCRQNAARCTPCRPGRRDGAGCSTQGSSAASAVE
jgi:hypothetical protein